MSDELLEAIAMFAGEAQQPQQEQPPAPELGLFFAPPSVPQEQVQALDAVFAHEKESADAAGLLGAWGAGMLIHDMAEDAKARRRDDEEARRREAAKPKPS
jgi:hypothetical protein